MGKRQEIKAKRKRAQQIQQSLTLGAIIVIALAFVGFLIYPSLKPAPELVLPDSIGTFNSQDMTLGNPDAPVTVEVFSDYQCPACGFYAQNEEEAFINEFVTTGKVYYIFRPFNFLGEESKLTGEAAYCALDQGKFWDYHEVVYYNMPGENTGILTEERLTQYAKAIGLDTKAFQKCLSSNQYVAKVSDDNRYAETSGVSGTPSFKIGDQVVGFKDFRNTVLAALEK